MGRIGLNRLFQVFDVYISAVRLFRKTLGFNVFLAMALVLGWAIFTFFLPYGLSVLLLYLSAFILLIFAGYNIFQRNLTAPVGLYTASEQTFRWPNWRYVVVSSCVGLLWTIIGISILGVAKMSLFLNFSVRKFPVSLDFFYIVGATGLIVICLYIGFFALFGTLLPMAADNEALNFRHCARSTGNPPEN